MSKDIARIGLVAVLLITASCASRPPADGPPRSTPGTSGLPPDAVPRSEPRSRYGNPPVYEVYGVRYQVLKSSYGYQERGVASWYGEKFHGRATSSQEPYDMHAMTAAHKTLPLPTYVRVRNLKNNKSIVVRVNDRGPFVDNRIIDLSYSAAVKLDMIREGTGLVEVTALSFDEAPRTVHRAPEPATTPPAAAAANQPANVQADVPGGEHKVYVQVGAFGDIDNAKRRFALLRDSGIGRALVHRDESRSPPLYRIRIGPIDGVDEYDAIVVKLKSIGISEAHLVTD